MGAEKQPLEELSRNVTTTYEPGSHLHNETIIASALCRIAKSLESIAASTARMEKRQLVVEARQKETDRKVTSLKGSLTKIRKEVQSA